MGAAHVFVDESKSKGFTLAAVSIDERRLHEARLGLRSFLLPGQRRIHFKSESQTRRRAILATLPGLGASAVIVATPQNMPALRARDAAMREMGLWAARIQAIRICIERDETVEGLDRRALFEVQSYTGSGFTYGHSRPYDEPLLWAADAVAWAWTRGGNWRAAADRIVTSVIDAGA